MLPPSVLTHARILAAAMLLALAVASAPRVLAQEPAATPLPVTEIAGGVFVYVAPYELATPANADAIGNAGFVVGANAVAVIDSGGSYAAGRRLLAAIRARTALPIRYVIATHVHPDHLLGHAAFVPTGATFVGHANLPDALAARAQTYLQATRDLIGEAAFAGTRTVEPTLLVSARLELDLGHRRLLLEAWPTAHTNTDLTVLDETSGTWFLGDLLFAGHVPALDGNLRGWLAAIALLKARPAARVVPGHGPAAMAWPDAALPMEHYLRRLADDVRAMIRDGRTIQQAGAEAGLSERNRWQLFDEFNARNAVTAFHELEWE